MRAGLVVESGEPREVAHLALLIGYGAGAVNPYLAFETIARSAATSAPGDRPGRRERRTTSRRSRRASSRSCPRWASAPSSSYQGAQIFEAIGIDQIVIDNYFTGTASRIRGVGLREIAEEALARHERGLRRRARARRLDVGGHIHLRVDGRARTSGRPKTVADAAERGARSRTPTSYDEYARAHQRSDASSPMTLRGLWDLAPAGAAGAARRGRAGGGDRASASRPARCRSAASPRRRTRTSPSR